MPRIWSVTWNHVDNQRPRCHKVHADLGGLCLYQGCSSIWALPATKSPIWVHSRPPAAKVCVMSMAYISTEVIGTIFHQPWDGWPCSLLSDAAGVLALLLKGELIPVLGRDGPTPHHRHAPHLESTLEPTLLFGMHMS